jgi:hypothetical protein
MYQLRKKQGSLETNQVNIQSKVGDLNKKLEKCSLKEEVSVDISQIWKNFKQFSKHEDFKHHKDTMTPLVEQCQKNVDVFREEVMATRKIISRFDEVLLEKASKFSVEQHRQECIKEFMQINQFNEFKKDTEKIRKEIRNEIDILKHVIDNEHDALFEKLQASMDRYAKILNASYGKPVDANELKLLLALKADKVETSQMINVKADQTEIHTNNQNLSILHNQIQQLMILLIEYLKIE